jgi:hypothetical protein
MKREGTGSARLPILLGKSSEVTDQNNVAALASSRKRELPPVTRPVEVEDQSRRKMSDLFRWSTG